MIGHYICNKQYAAAFSRNAELESERFFRALTKKTIENCTENIKIFIRSTE